MAIITLPPLDPARDFIVARDQILWRGLVLERGAHFPKETASKRSLRLLYETRAITYGTADQKSPEQPQGEGPPLLTNPAQLGPSPDEIKLALVQDNTAAKLRAMLDEMGVAYEPRANKTQLAEAFMKARNVAATE